MSTIDAIAGSLRRTHGLSVISVESVPGGYAAECYDVRAVEGRYFLKSWPDTERGRRNAARQPRALAVASRLAGSSLAERWKSGGAFVVAPLPATDCSLLQSLDNGLPFALFPFVEAAELMEEARRTHSLVLGYNLAALHQSMDEVRDLLEPADPHDISVLDGLRRSMTRLQRATSGERPAIGSLRSVLVAHEAEIERRAARLRDLRERLAATPANLALCHGDFRRSNAIFVLNGHVSVENSETGEEEDVARLGVGIVDWDEVMLAPAEHDLAVCADNGESLDMLLGSYFIGMRMSAVPYPLSMDEFEFALVRRALEDITARLDVLLDDSTGHDEDTIAIFGIEALGHARWQTLDATLARLWTTLVI